MAERLSLADDTILYGYAHHIQRYEFASRYCGGKRVLDAGCGTGYGSHYLVTHGASEVVAVDIAKDALDEARRIYLHPNLTFREADCEKLSQALGTDRPFDTIVNLENLEHLRDGASFTREARACLKDEGHLVVSTPNGELTARDATGNIKNIYHIYEYTVDEFTVLLKRCFSDILLFGQWRTPASKARLIDERQRFDTLCELYYNPLARAWRAVKKSLGKPCAPGPRYTAEGLGLPWDFSIAPLTPPLFPWAPEVILAVCRV